jgi:hypothetical protein
MTAVFMNTIFICPRVCEQALNIAHFGDKSSNGGRSELSQKQAIADGGHLEFNGMKAHNG